MKSSFRDLSLANRLPDIRRVTADAEGFFAAGGIVPEVGMRLSLVLDELLTNVISYAWPDGGAHEIQVRLGIDDNTVSMEVRDDGIAFDPFAVAAPDLDLGIEDRPIGGLGIHLVRRVMDHCEYRRENGLNHVVLTKRVRGRNWMEVVENIEGGVVSLGISGRLDSNTSDSLGERLEKHLDAKPRALVLDCGGLDYMSSAGLRVMLMAAKRSKADQVGLALHSLKPGVLEIFEMSGLMKVFPIHPDGSAALAAVN